jgi:hypothetical protein
MLQLVVGLGNLKVRRYKQHLFCVVNPNDKLKHVGHLELVPYALQSFSC